MPKKPSQRWGKRANKDGGRVEVSERTAGRPGQLDDAVIEKIVQAVRLGIRKWYKIAQYAGVPVKTLAEWRRVGALDIEGGTESVYADLLRQIEPARVQAEVTSLALLTQLARGGREVKRTTIRYDKDNNVVYRIEEVSELAPDRGALKDLLGFVDPETYGPKLSVSLEDELIAAGKDPEEIKWQLAQLFLRSPISDSGGRPVIVDGRSVGESADLEGGGETITDRGEVPRSTSPDRSEHVSEISEIPISSETVRDGDSGSPVDAGSNQDSEERPG